MEIIPCNKEPSVSIITDEKDPNSTLALELYISNQKERGNIFADGFKYVVAMENSVENIAIDTIDKTTRVVIFSAHTEEYLHLLARRCPTASILLDIFPDNVRIVAMDKVGSISQDGIPSIFETKQTLETQLDKNLIAYFAQKLRKYTHDARRLEDRADEKGKEMLAELVEKFKEEMPAFQSATPDEIVHYLKIIGTSTNQKTKFKGKYLRGVYCDAQGTLIQEGNIISKEVLSQLKNYESQGHTVTIWTGGNTKEIRSLLKSEGVGYKVVSKYKYRGAKAEIVLDDLRVDEFFREYGITPENFTRVFETK